MAKTNSQVLAELRKKLDGVSHQAIQQRRARLQELVAMPSDIATYIVAQRNGVPIQRYLDTSTLETVATFEGRLAAKEGAPTSSGQGTSAKAKPTKREVVVSIAGIHVDRLPGMTQAHAIEAKQMAEKVYPALYVFENSARDVISRLLEEGVGPDWWNEVVKKELRDKAAKRKKDESKDPWHGKRAAAPIDYLDLSDLPLIVSASKAWPHLKNVFPRIAWFQELVNELNVSRRVAAHMNPLESDDIKNVEAAFRKWAKLLKAKQDLLP